MGLKNSKPPLLPREEINPKPFFIPEDIIEEILSRLPAKSLLRFRCVSKSWRSLIGKKLFIKNHLQNITENETYANWGVIYNCFEHGLKQCSMQSYNNEPSVDLSPIDDPENNHLMTDVVVVGHCNGVLCILKKQGYFFLWNPTTRRSIELPRIKLSVTTKYGFGWDEDNDAYKVFVVGSYQGQNIGKVYSTNTNSWKTVEHGCLSLYDEYYGKLGVFASGKIHWLKEGGHHIETFDLNSEVFGKMDNPCKPEVGEYMSLYEETDGCLGVACQSTNNNKIHWRLWVMKEYGEKESLVEWIATNDKKKKNKSWVEWIDTEDTNFSCCQVDCYYIESLVSPASEKKKRSRFFNFFI